MQIPRYWRTQKQRYALVGEVCPHCSAKLFPARAICPHCGSSLDSSFAMSEMGQEFAIAVTSELPERVEVTVR